ncbi:predicted protein [Sclerotinia sclerotiorum 1980 UF-70]|uniref:Uncharacterized protein n=1 Tax=Sclerotinia sclerotiorum (strain ATCC 18683 / 1980 / Ss-1) TaxID=665079 RepID=A7E817_SCLS1|nr:predicted protein [Sclerotinia sclerotiorum 1980 UF-70]EDN96519.1 predicted protein [Sclerotinia sclerotiorum 1980 UF-70]
MVGQFAARKELATEESAEERRSKGRISEIKPTTDTENETKEKIAFCSVPRRTIFDKTVKPVIQKVNCAIQAKAHSLDKLGAARDDKSQNPFPRSSKRHLK